MLYDEFAELQRGLIGLVLLAKVESSGIRRKQDAKSKRIYDATW